MRVYVHPTGQRSIPVPEHDKGRQRYFEKLGWTIGENYATEHQLGAVAGLNDHQRFLLADAGYTSPDDLRAASDDELLALPFIDARRLRAVRQSIAAMEVKWPPADEQAVEADVEAPPAGEVAPPTHQFTVALSDATVAALHALGKAPMTDLYRMSNEDLLAVEGIGPATLRAIRSAEAALEDD